MAITNVSILANIAESLISVQKLISAWAYLIGIAFVMKAVYSLKVYGEQRSMMSSNSSIKEPVMYLFAGSLLLFFPTGFQVMMNTVFGYSSVLQYAPLSSQSPILSALFGQSSQIGQYLAIIIQTIGGFSFVRGWVLIARSAAQGQPPGGTGKGLTHVFGGVLAMNIVGTLQVLNNTLYGT